jgi:hypothetical protein
MTQDKQTAKSHRIAPGRRKEIEVVKSSYGVIFVAHTLDAARELRERGRVPLVELWR